MDLLEGIATRRSIRKYTDRPVTQEQLREIVKAGTLAPSGLNNQPWRFVTVRERSVLDSLARLTKSGHVLRGAPACIVVFVDRKAMYHEVKDHQAMGACIQNLLLAAHGMGMGAVWLGEILKSEKQVRDLFGVKDTMDRMAVVALGWPAEKGGTADRKPLDSVLLKKL